MLSAAVFHAKNQAQKYINIQKKMLNINESDYETTLSLLLSSDLISDLDKIEELLHLLIEVVDERPKNTMFYVKITENIILKLPEFKQLLQDFLLSTFDRKTKRVYFLFNLVQNKIILIDDVLNFIDQLFKDRTLQYMRLQRKLAMYLFYWFSPEFSKLENFQKYSEFLKNVHNSPYFKTLTDINLAYIRDFEKLSANDWELHKKYRERGMSYDEVAVAIYNNDVSYFENCLGNGNIDDIINKTIEPTVFEAGQFLNHFPTCLQYSAFLGSADVFKWLLDHGANRNLCDNKNRRLEDYAIAGGNQEIISIVFKDYDHGSETIQVVQREVQRGRRRRNNATDIGAERTFTSCSKRTQKRFLSDENQSQQNQGPQTSISSNGYSNLIVAKFNRYGVIPPQIDENVFFKCCQYDCFELLIYAIEKGMNPNLTNKDNIPAITIACQYGNIDIVKFMSQLPDINLSAIDSTGGTPLVRAALYRSLPIVKYLITCDNVDINAGDERGTTAFIFAAMNGDLKMTQFLANQKDVDLNAMDEYVGPAFVHASIHGHLDIIKFLLTKEKNGLNLQGDYITYAIIHAANRGYIDIIKFLQNRDGVNLNIKNLYDENVLTSAANGKQLETLKYLVTIDGLDINLPGPNGNSALCTSAIVGDLEAVKFLCSLPNIDINFKNNYDANALKLAIDNKHMEIADYLRSIGCEEL